MKETEILEGLFRKYGYTKYKWVEPRDIVTGQWVRMKCMFGCKGYGRSGSCLPNVPSVSECRQFFDEYKKAAIIRFEKGTEKPEDRIAWARDVNKGLLALEREQLS